jgi:putative addiction module component (TIGR02574 family)
MKAELEKELSELSLEEKNEVFTFLMPYVTPDFEDEPVSAELMEELERRLAAHKADPSGSITIEEFKQRQFAGN